MLSFTVSPSDTIIAKMLNWDDQNKMNSYRSELQNKSVTWKETLHLVKSATDIAKIIFRAGLSFEHGIKKGTIRCAQFNSNRILIRALLNLVNNIGKWSVQIFFLVVKCQSYQIIFVTPHSPWPTIYPSILKNHKSFYSFNNYFSQRT